LGCSYIVGTGSYEGGELWVQDEDAGEEAVEHTLDPNFEDISSHYAAGSSFRGRVEDIKDRWTQFDGNKLHFTHPFTGSRYSIIFFTCDAYSRVSADIRSALQDRGFDFDWDSTDIGDKLRHKLADKAELREQLAKARAEEALQDRMRRGRCIARIWADGWGHQCTAVCSLDEENPNVVPQMCLTHISGDRWKTHGRFDGDLPPAKREEMRRTQVKWLKQGKLPPPDEPWTKLVEVTPQAKPAGEKTSGGVQTKLQFASKK